jgi:polyisoprenyl-phosphate glycosyltransferase
MKRNTQITVVVPFLNEEDNLPELYRRLKAVFDARSETPEFLFVDDGSTDGSVQWLEKTATEDSNVRKLRLARNFGHQAAITAGLDHATGDAVLIMDADLQDPPEVIPELIAAWRAGGEVVYAVRRRREGEHLLKRLLASGFYRLFRAFCSVEVPVDAGDFRLLDRKVVEALKSMRETHRYMRGMTSWVGFSQRAVEYDRAERFAGATKYPLWKSLRLAWDGVTSFSAKPLLWMTNAGVLIAGLSAVFALHIVYGKLTGREDLVTGWASLAVLVLFLGGLQMASVGLLGQYLSRIFDETKKRPIYILRAANDPDGDFARRAGER